MSYTGSITIVDDKGEAVFEQELSQEEIIEALLAAIPEGGADAPEESQKPSKQGSGRKCGACGRTGHNAKTCTNEREEVSGDGRPCCGSLGHRHKKGCKEGGITSDPQNRRTVDDRVPFSEPTFDVVKTLLEDRNRTVDDISAEKGLDLQEVRRCNLANDYQDYLTIA